MKLKPVFSLTTLLQRLRSSVEQSTQLLAPRSTSCATCGRSLIQAHSGSKAISLKLSSQLRHNLCGVCLSAIPWMSRIRCPVCGRRIECDDCLRRTQLFFVCNRSAVEYDSTMRDWLARYKYRGDEQLAPLLADMLLPAFERLTAEITEQQNQQLGPQLQSQLRSSPKLKASKSGRSTQMKASKSGRISHHILAQCWDAITFVPISTERSLERGFNQAEQLAAHLAARYRLPLLSLLIRSIHAEKMSFKSRSERMRDVKSLFAANHLELQKLKRNEKARPMQPVQASKEALRVLLIDDIYTTGSTANACSEVLKLHAAMPLDVYILTWARS